MKLPARLEELRQQLSGIWRMFPGERQDTVVDETCLVSPRGPFLETIVETKIGGRIVHRVRGGFAWNPKRRALVTWSKEGDRLRHFGYQKATPAGDLAFECRFFPSGDQDLLIVHIDGRNLEIRRVASGDRIAFVRGRV
jgi:hypothetical protein